MNIQFSLMHDFAALKKFISVKLSSREKRSINLPEYKKSAVMILFMQKDGSPHVILTLRTHKVSTHKGQISFPGGGYDSSDRHMLDTALRETMEEIGILPDQIEVLGEFDEYMSIMGYHVSVFVGAVNIVPDYAVNWDEIEEMIEVPFSLFYNEEYSKCEKVSYQGKEYDVYYYDYGKATIWGLTALILTDFSRKLLKGND